MRRSLLLLATSLLHRVAAPLPLHCAFRANEGGWLAQAALAAANRSLLATVDRERRAA